MTTLWLKVLFMPPIHLIVIASASHIRTRGLSPLLADVLTCVLTFAATAIYRRRTHFYPSFLHK